MPYRLSHLLHPQPLALPEASSKAKDPPAKRKVRRLVSNSARCKLYRDQKQQYEDMLVAKISALKQELSTLQRGLWQEKALLLRHVSMGSLDKLAREYFACVEYGLASVVVPPADGQTPSQRRLMDQMNDRVRSQEAFLNHLMDPQVTVGPMTGVGSLLAILRRKAAMFANSRIMLTSLEVVGSQESPVVVAWAVMQVTLTHESFRTFLPGAAANNELIHKYLHTTLTVESTTTFHFTREGRVKHVATESSYIASLIRSGWSVSDAARALPNAQLPPALLKNQGAACPALSALSATPAYPSREALVALVYECCTLFEIGMEKLPPLVSVVADAKTKQAFLRRVLDTNVEFGNIAGMEAVIRFLLRFADVLVDIRKQITNVSVAGDATEPILIVHLKNEMPGYLIASMMAESDSNVSWNAWDTDLTCLSKAQFHFTQDGRISLCSFASGCSEALRVAGVGLEETCQVLQWFASLVPLIDTGATSPADQSTGTHSGTISSSDLPSQPPQKCKPKTNRERGQAFRQRQKQFEQELEGSVKQLRNTVSELQARRKELESHNNHTSAT